MNKSTPSDRRRTYMYSHNLELSCSKLTMPLGNETIKFSNVLHGNTMLLFANNVKSICMAKALHNFQQKKIFTH